MNRENHELILGRLHLEGVLGVIPEFFRHDPEAKKILPKHPFALRLSTSEGLEQTLRFTPDGVETSAQGRSLPTLTLFFLSNSQLNRLFLRDGLSVPIPLGNPLLLPKLLLFNKCMSLLELRLKSTELPLGTLQNPLDLWLQFLVALYGLEAVGTLDHKVMHCLERCPHGTAEFSVQGTEFVATAEWNGKSVKVRPGRPVQKPDARISFANPDVLEQALRQNLDQMAAVPLGMIHIEGLIPLAEALGIVSDRISYYLQPK